MLLQIIAAMASARKIGVTLSGATVSHNTSGGNATAGIIFNTDGTVDSLIGAATAQLSAPTDWIIPNGDVSDGFDVRITNVVFAEGAGFDTETAVEDAWGDLTAGLHQWVIVDSTASAAGDKDVTFTVEIRDQATETLQDSASYRLVADYDSS